MSGRKNARDTLAYQQWPLATVITPVHQTPLPLFEAAFRSLLSQSCGFERIEWLVAVHNMDDEYTASLKQITGERDNIIYLHADGPASPAVPRNLCLSHARGEYLFFLDSDDRMADDSIKQVILAMRESGAQAAVFNCAVITEKGDDEIITPGSLNAPDEDLVLYEKGDPRILSLMGLWGAMMWSWAYRRELVIESGVRFDERQRMGSDLLFNLAVASMAECICAMPHYIAYYYRERTGSIIQSQMSGGGKEEDILRYLPVIQKYDGMEMLWFHVSWFLRKMIMKGPGSSLSPKEKKGLEPVVSGLRVMAPRFAYTREFMSEMLHAGKILFSLSSSPRLRQRYEILDYPLYEEEIKQRVKAAAAENIELRTVGTEAPYNPFLGIEDPRSCPQVYVSDIRRKTRPRQDEFMESYRRMELLRGFKDGAEVRCRVTVFHLSEFSCALSITWDEGFVGERGIVRLRDRIAGDMWKYAPQHFTTVRDMLRWQKLMDGERVVFCYREGEKTVNITRKELSDQIDSLSKALVHMDLQDRRIALVLENSYDFILIYLTLLCEGITVISLDPALSAKELKRRLVLTDAAAVFLEDDAPEPAMDGLQIIRRFQLCALLDKGRSLPSSCGADTPIVTPERAAVIMFTSGTTGYGKAAVITQKNLMASARNASSHMEWLERCMLCLPFHHIAMQQDILYMLYEGCRIMISSPQLDVMLRDMQEFLPQSIHLVPRLLKLLSMLLTNDKASPISSLKRIFCGTSPAPDSLAETFEHAGIRVFNQYGLTESTGPVVRSSFSGLKHGMEMYPFPDTELRIDTNGEVLIRSPMVFSAYLNDPVSTAQVLDTDGWLHTGDLGYLNDDGALIINGRIKNLIIFSNGEKVSPEELEQQLSELPEVEECLVYADHEEEIAVKIYPCLELRSLEEKEQHRILWERIAGINETNPAYMRMDRLYVEQYPLERNSTGKLLRQERL